MYRTHTCGELRKEDAGNEVTLAGWADSVRVQGRIGFVLLRDRYGITQCFINPKLVESCDLANIRKESVLQIKGEVKARPENQVRSEMATGEIELSATSVEILNPAAPLPLELDESVESNDDTRMKYRFLDFRTKRMQENIATRHKVAKAMRDWLDKNKFLEIETPFLAKSTPEGARDYLVPSRLSKGSFYALPQSPQLFKQLFMVGGFDRYAQVVKCFRDEDLRGDRQPEFTQVDIEMSFVDEEDVLEAIEGLIAHVFKEVKGIEIQLPLPRKSYKECMEKYDSDRPDLREEMETEWALFWVTDFPMFEYNEDEKRWYAMHHPFTQPRELDLMEKGELGKVYSKGYDLVLNGSEIAGGSIRNHRLDIQELIFKVLGIEKEEQEEKFGFLLEALKFGAPPHGGIAFGFDRLVALLCGEAHIRDVIAYPKNKDARDLMLDAPSSVYPAQLEELGLALKK
jgi:aspartyl-tRNA synthetase